MPESKASFSISRTEKAERNHNRCVLFFFFLLFFDLLSLPRIYLSILLYRYISDSFLFFFSFPFPSLSFFSLFFFNQIRKIEEPFFPNIAFEKSINDGYSIDDTSLHCSFLLSVAFKYDTDLCRFSIILLLSLVACRLCVFFLSPFFLFFLIFFIVTQSVSQTQLVSHVQISRHSFTRICFAVGFLSLSFFFAAVAVVVVAVTVVVIVVVVVVVDDDVALILLTCSVLRVVAAGGAR